MIWVIHKDSKGLSVLFGSALEGSHYPLVPSLGTSHWVMDCHSPSCAPRLPNAFLAWYYWYAVRTMYLGERIRDLNFDAL